MAKYIVEMSNGGGEVKVEAKFNVSCSCIASAIASIGEKAFRDVRIIDDEEMGRVIYNRYYDDDFYAPKLECDEALREIRYILGNHY